MIFTDTVHDAPAESAPPAKLTEVDPATPVATPPHVEFKLGAAATCKPAGKLSLNAKPLNGRCVLVLVTVNVKLVAPFNGIVAAPKALTIEGGLMMVRVSEAVPPVPPFVEVIAFVVFRNTPSVAPVTFTENVHAVFTGRVVPLRETVPDPAVAVIVPPPQDPVNPFGVLTTIPAGKLSVNATPATLTTFAGGFATWKLSEVTPFTGIGVAPKFFETVGGATTSIVIVALALVAWPSFAVKVNVSAPAKPAFGV